MLETIDLSFGYRSQAAILERVNIQVPHGCIYGFLGPNGAGKTTTLRLALGLLRIQSGQIQIRGKSLSQNRRELLSTVGSMIESPSIYGHLSAHENLRIWQVLYGCPKSRIDQVLEVVGLTDTKRKLAGHFSLGMKQRLSIAIAMLNKPSLLILDEPTNGLDPNGILEIRELMKGLNRQFGTTILVSSHMLSEIGRVATHIGVIHQGRMVYQGTYQHLMAQQLKSSTISFVTNNPERAQAILSHAGLVVTRRGDTIETSFVDEPSRAELNRQMVLQGLSVFEIRTNILDLESIYFQLVAGSQDD